MSLSRYFCSFVVVCLYVYHFGVFIYLLTLVLNPLALEDPGIFEEGGRAGRIDTLALHFGTVWRSQATERHPNTYNMSYTR